MTNGYWSLPDTPFAYMPTSRPVTLKPVTMQGARMSMPFTTGTALAFYGYRPGEDQDLGGVVTSDNHQLTRGGFADAGQALAGADDQRRFRQHGRGVGRRHPVQVGLRILAAMLAGMMLSAAGSTVS